MRTDHQLQTNDKQPAPLPLYWRIYSVLREEIVDREYSAKVPIPTEGELSARFSTSRITIRKVMEMLRAEGLIYTRRGVGTFVVSPLPSASKPSSFTANLTSMYRHTSTQVLEFGLVPATDNVASLLNVAPESPVHRAVRLRCQKGRPDQPIGLLTTYIVPDLAQNFTREDFEANPLFDLFRRVGRPSVTARQRVTARSADPFSAEHLKVEIGTPILCMFRVSYDETGTAISYLRSFFRPDRYEIELELEVNTVSQIAAWRLPGDAGQSAKHTALFDLDIDAT